MFLDYLRFDTTVLLINIHIFSCFRNQGQILNKMDWLRFFKFDFHFFRKFPWEKVKFFFLIFVESISFDAEPEEGEIYMVPFVFFAFILILTVIFRGKGEIPQRPMFFLYPLNS